MIDKYGTADPTEIDALIKVRKQQLKALKNAPFIARSLLRIARFSSLRIASRRLGASTNFGAISAVGMGSGSAAAPALVSEPAYLSES